MSITSADAPGQPADDLRSRKKRATHGRIYDAALELFAERAYADVTVEEICERAEVGRATFFRFFGSKAGLLVEFNSRLTQRIADRLDAMVGASATDRLLAAQAEVADAWGSSSAADREMAREYIRNATAADLQASSPSEIVSLLAEVVADGQRDGEFRTEHPSTFVASVLMMNCACITGGWLADADATRLSTEMRGAVTLLLHGLARAKESA